MLLSQDTVMLAKDPEEHDRGKWKKRRKYTVRCKDAAWRRWKREYQTTLRERHNMTHKTKVAKIDIGNVVMIKREDKRRRKQKIAVVKELYQGEDKETQSVQVKTAKRCLERPIKLLYTVEIHCSETTLVEIAPRT